MKKCLLILAAFLLTPSTGAAETVFNDAATFVVAKAVKLGRGKSAFSSQNGALGANQGATKIDDGSCKASSDCEKGQKCSNKQCVACADGEKCDTCPTNYVGNGKGGCRIQCIKGQADCELCTRGQVYDGTKCRLPCDGVTCPSGTTCQNGTTSACCVPDEKKCTVANCSNCNTVTGQCEGGASGYSALFSFDTGGIIDCVKLTRTCLTGQYNDGNNNCLACANGSKCNTCPSATPYWCSSSNSCSASASCNSCSSDSDCTVSSGYACVSGKCTKKCSSSSLPYWCSVKSSCTASAAACRNLNLNLAGDCYQPTEAERCNCSGNKTINQTLQTKLMCAVERIEACDCSFY